MEARRRRLRAALAATQTGSAAKPPAAAPAISRMEHFDMLESHSEQLDATRQDLDAVHTKRPRVSVYEDADIEQVVQPPSSVADQPAHPAAVDPLSIDAMAVRLAHVLFGDKGGPARSGDGPCIEELTNKLLVRAFKAFTSVKETHAKQLAEAKVHREHGVAWLLADMSFKAGSALPDRATAEKAGKRVGTHLGGEKGVIKKLEIIAAAHTAAGKAAKARHLAEQLTEIEVEMDLADLEQNERRALSDVENAPYVLIKDVAVLRNDGDHDGPAASAGQREYEAEQAKAFTTAAECVQLLLEPLRSPIEDYIKMRQNGNQLTIRPGLNASTRPIWREACEATMLAKGLVDREMLEMLRDRDADVEYWREANQEKRRRLAAVNREREALERQVLALGGTLDPYRGRGWADAMVMSDEEIEGFADGRGHGAAERAGLSVLQMSK